MPIFHDSLHGSEPPNTHDTNCNVQDRFSYRNMTDDTRAASPEQRNVAVTYKDRAFVGEERRPVSREELIERIKRGESPTWRMRRNGVTPDRTASRSPLQQRPSPPTLLPAAELKEPEMPALQQQPVQDNYMVGLEIERPRSALHSGDFHSDKSSSVGSVDTTHNPIATSPPAPWLFSAPRSYDERPLSRARAGSHSLSTVVLMPPTSPLVQAINHADLDYPSRPVSRRRNSPSPRRDNRRHTFSPQSFQTFQSHYLDSPTNRTVPTLRRDSTFPYQAHQPRRAFTSSIGLAYPSSASQTPFFRPRGVSTSSEASPLHHAPMVGSYEESILRGRMSTTPSRPLNFIAQIGVLGKGKCKSSLRCPPHVIIPFPAVFYSYSSGNGRILDNQPSPYVGLIDLENHLPAYEETEGDKRRRRCSPHPSEMEEPDLHGRPMPSTSESNSATHLLRKRERLKRRSQSPKAPPGGAYRIPQQGQLQIVIKNPNKTAVKLFLVPYDLSDMEPGSKTFIRQRSYSAGPIIDMPLSSRRNLGTDRPEAALSSSEDPADRPTLRYLIHLHICCPAKGRYFLYKSVRVVFANRVPDGKEKLRNETQLPEPRYSTYKPSRDSLTPAHNSTIAATTIANPAAHLAENKAARRLSGTPLNFAEQLRSARGLSLATGMEQMDGLAATTAPSHRLGFGMQSTPEEAEPVRSFWPPAPPPPPPPLAGLSTTNPTPGSEGDDPFCTAESFAKTAQLPRSPMLVDSPVVEGDGGPASPCPPPRGAASLVPVQEGLAGLDASSAWMRGSSLIRRRLMELERGESEWEG